MLVTLALLAEYGAFEILQFRTFTVEIFAEFKLGFDAVGACVLSLVLVVLSVGVLAGEPLLAGRRPQSRSGKGARRPARAPAARRRARSPALAGGLAAARSWRSGCPVATLVYWMVHGGSSTLPESSLLAALGSTAAFSAAAAVLATLLAAAVATLALRHRSRASALLERITYLPLALPGLVIALGLVAFAVRYTPALYQSPVLLVVAYAILFLPLAVVAVRASLAGAPARLEDVARSLGLRPDARVPARDAAGDRPGPRRRVRASCSSPRRPS